MDVFGCGFEWKVPDASENFVLRGLNTMADSLGGSCERDKGVVEY